MGRLNAGQLNQRITLLIPGPSVPDGRGGQVAGPATASARWALVRPLRTAEKLALGQTLDSASYEITLRQQTGETVSAHERVRWKGLDLNVQGVSPDEYNEYWLLTCFNSGK